MYKHTPSTNSLLTLIFLRPLLIFLFITTFIFYSQSGLSGYTNSQTPYPKPLINSPQPKFTPYKHSHKMQAKPPLVHFTNFDTEHGLALSSVTYIFKDNSNHLWFGTHGGGVSRFDGRDFTTFTTKHGMPHNSIWSIIEDKNGHYWFGTFGGGVSYYDGYYFKNYTVDDGLADNTIWSILEDHNGDVWFGTFGGGVSRYDGKDFTTFTTEDGLASNIVWCIFEDNNNNLWFGTDNGGVSFFDGETFTNYSTSDGLAYNTVRSITQDKNKHLWFGTYGGGVSRYDGKSFTNYTIEDGLAHNHIRRSYTDTRGKVWFGTNGGGVSYYNGKGFETLTEAEGLAHNTVMSIAEDAYGNVWFGTRGGGVSRYNGKSFSFYTKEQGLTHNSIRHIIQDSKGNLWFATNGGGAARFDGKYFTHFTIEQGLIHNIIYCIFEDSKGNIWFGSDGEGVSKFDGQNFTNYTVEQGLAGERVFSIFENIDGKIWFGTSNGASVYDGNSFKTYTVKHGLSHNLIRNINSDNNGNLWFATYGSGVSVFDGDIFTNYTVDNGLAHNWVRKILIDKSGNIWLGTYGGGLNRYDGKHFTTFSTEDGMVDDVVYDIVEDEKGTIWVGTNHGFSSLSFTTHTNGEIIPAGAIKLNNKTLNRYYQPKWEVYNNNTGFPVKALNSNAMCITEKSLPYGREEDTGVIWGGCGDDIVVRFNPKALHKKTEPPIVNIKNIRIKEENICWHTLKIREKDIDSLILAHQQAKVYGRLMSADEKDSLLHHFSGIRYDKVAKFYAIPKNLVLPYSHNHITFEYNAVETSRNFMVNFKYMLKGKDTDWRPITKSASANFGNLWEGEYTFKIKAQSPDGIWSEPVSYTFRVLPPWWRTWWMFLIYIILIAFSFYALLKLRVRKLKKEKNKLEQVVKKRTLELLQQKEEAENQKALVEEQNYKISQQKEEIKAQSDKLEDINRNLEERIAKELEKSRKKDLMLIQQNRLAEMGEMIGNIAHQWRQPLNALSIIIQNLQDAKQNGELTDQYLEGKVKQSMEVIHFMAQTISDFKDFFKPDKTAREFLINDVIKKSISFVEASMISNNITIDYRPVEDVYAKGYPNEYAQVVLNLLNNARDVLLERNIEQPKIEISLLVKDKKSHLWISDNGGGIKPKVAEKLFTPYFTTKKANEGTGLGLYMSKTIIEKNKGGKITFENTKDGAKFIVII